MFDFLKKSFDNAVSKIVRACESTCSEKDIEQEIKNLEITLLQANVSAGAAENICKKLHENISSNKKLSKKNLANTLKKALGESLDETLNLQKIDLIKEIDSKQPFVILFVGFNGVGKTTTIAKVANYLRARNKKCVFAAADTFRAAAIEQLGVWANDLKIPIIKHKYESDPASVAFDAVSYAKANKIDVVLIDTAGRSNTNINLMNELEKIKRVSKPNLTLVVVDALTGNDGINQVVAFEKTLGVNALIVSKLDADEIGGSIISLAYEFKKPILFIGSGQGKDNLEEFDKDKILKKILPKEN